MNPYRVEKLWVGSIIFWAVVCQDGEVLRLPSEEAAEDTAFALNAANRKRLRAKELLSFWGGGEKEV